MSRPNLPLRSIIALGMLISGIGIAGCPAGPSGSTAGYVELLDLPMSRFSLDIKNLDEIPGEPPATEPVPATVDQIIATCSVTFIKDRAGAFGYPYPFSKLATLRISRPVKMRDISKDPLYPVQWRFLWLNSENSGTCAPAMIAVLERPAGVFGWMGTSCLFSAPIDDGQYFVPAGWRLSSARKVAQTYFPKDLVGKPFQMERVFFGNNISRPRDFFWRIAGSTAPYFVGDDGIAYHAKKGYDLAGPDNLLAYANTVVLERLTPVTGQVDSLDLPVPEATQDATPSVRWNRGQE